MQADKGGPFEAVVVTARHLFFPTENQERLQWFVTADLNPLSRIAQRVPIPDEAIVMAGDLLPPQYVKVRAC